MRLWGVIGWKNAGKTGLVERLVAEFVARGFRVSTVKHAHHGFEPDTPGKDSHRHRLAGASEVLCVSPDRFMLTGAVGDTPLAALLARLAPVDLVLVEGYKTGAHPKIEVVATGNDRPLVAATDAEVRAIAADTPLDGLGRPVFARDDTAAIADFIARESNL